MCFLLCRVGKPSPELCLKDRSFTNDSQLYRSCGNKKRAHSHRGISSNPNKILVYRLIDLHRPLTEPSPHTTDPIHIISPITSLRWYDPDQVQRVRHLAVPSQPGISGSPSKLLLLFKRNGLTSSFVCIKVHTRLSHSEHIFNLYFPSNPRELPQHETHLCRRLHNNRRIFPKCLFRQPADGSG